jgi:hypothetical protein
VETLRSLFPTGDALLAISPEDLAPLLLARARLQPAGFWPDSILNEPGVTGEPDNAYPHYKKTQVEAHVHEAWQSLEREGLIGPSPGMNGRNGWMSLTRAVGNGHMTDAEPPLADRADAALARHRRGP